jgi:hypothetical protein
MTPRLLTYFDVKKVFATHTQGGRHLPKGVVRLNIFSEAVELGLLNLKTYRASVKSVLKDWFGEAYNSKKSVFTFEQGGELPIEFSQEKPFYETGGNDYQPDWASVAYANDTVNLPPPLDTHIQLKTFYSYHDLPEKAKELEEHVNEALKLGFDVLVIDTDIESPRLSRSSTATLSFMDYLNLQHYPPETAEASFDYAVAEIKHSLVQSGEAKCYTLPACLNPLDLLDPDICLEHLIQHKERAWDATQAIYDLGLALEVKYIFINLRSGISNLTSPLLFDPRIERYLLTTPDESSVLGTALVLSQLQKTAPKVKEYGYFDPKVIIVTVRRQSGGNLGGRIGGDPFSNYGVDIQYVRYD